MITGGNRFWSDPALVGEELAQVLFMAVQTIVDEQKSLRDRWLTNLRFYHNRKIETSSYDTTDWFDDQDRDAGAQTDDSEFRSWNVCRAIADALVSRIALHDPSPRIQTTNASEAIQSRARKLETLVLSAMRTGRYNEAAARALETSTCCSTGFVKVFPRFGAVHYEAYGPDRVIVDNRAVRNGKPSTIFHRELVDIADLRALYRKDKKALAVLDMARPLEGSDGGSSTREQVEVIEAVREPFGDRPGRRVVAIRSGTLSAEKWTRRSYWTWIHYQRPRGGFYGESLLEPIIGNQREINYVLTQARLAARNQARNWLRTDRHPQKAFQEADLDPASDKVISGDMDLITPPLANPQWMQVANMHFGKAFEITGLNELAAHGAIPAGLESGAAVREFHDRQSERFSQVAKADENLATDAGELTVLAGKDISKSGTWEVKGVGRNFVQSIKWSDVSLKDDQFAISVYPASSLPLSPAGRRAELTEAMNSGLIEKEQAQALLAWNDISKYQKMQAAPLDALELELEQLISSGTYKPPTRFSNLQLALRMGHLYHEMHRVEGTDEKRIQLIERWIVDVEDLLGINQPQPAPAIEVPTGIAANPEAAAQLAAAGAAVDQPAAVLPPA